MALVRALMHEPGEGWQEGSGLVEVIAAHTLDEVLPALQRVENRTVVGCTAIGFITYESSPAFDAALTTRSPDPALPLLWFGVFERALPIAFPAAAFTDMPFLAWRNGVDEDDMTGKIAKLREYIGAGDVYQANLTTRLHGTLSVEPWLAFQMLCASCEPRHGAFIDTGDHAILSLSPELYFRREGPSFVSKPMKGTAVRGPHREADQLREEALRGSPKERAENLMIADMVRNDLGRIAIVGSVEVPQLFEVERHGPLLQMVTEVRAQSDASLVEMFGALFPPASITGAPKKRAMEIIAELEDSPRGVYTGAIGTVGPGSKAQFSVGIRTLVVRREGGECEYGVGSGVVWDSCPGDEVEEVRAKAWAVTRPQPAFELLESIRWDGDSGYYLLDEHLERLEASADYFGFCMRLNDIRNLLFQYADGLPTTPHKVRVTVGRHGSVNVSSATLVEERIPMVLALAPAPVDPSDPFLYHKTTNRATYESARASSLHADEVLLWNDKGELTEATASNLAVLIAGEWVTPPMECGLLPGVLRMHLLATQKLTERVVRVEDLSAIDGLALLNSVRGWREAELVMPEGR